MRKKHRPAAASRDEDADELTKAQVRELRRRLADARDPVRYLIVSDFGPRSKLYYNVSDDVYVLNEPARATLFKRRRAAAAVGKLLGPGKRILRCRTVRRADGNRIPVLGGGSGRRPGRRPGRGRWPGPGGTGPHLLAARAPPADPGRQEVSRQGDEGETAGRRAGRRPAVGFSQREAWYSTAVT